MTLHIIYFIFLNYFLNVFSKEMRESLGRTQHEKKIEFQNFVWSFSDLREINRQKYTIFIDLIRSFFSCIGSCIKLLNVEKIKTWNEIKRKWICNIRICFRQLLLLLNWNIFISIGFNGIPNLYFFRGIGTCVTEIDSVMFCFQSPFLMKLWLVIKKQ